MSLVLRVYYVILLFCVTAIILYIQHTKMWTWIMNILKTTVTCRLLLMFWLYLLISDTLQRWCIYIELILKK